MNAYQWASIGAVVGLLLYLLYLRRRNGLAGAEGRGDTAMARQELPPTPRHTVPPRTSARFHAVTVRPCLEACDAVQAMAGERFLSHEAPALPLKNCDQARCECIYRHFSDRRAQGDRRSGWDTFGAFSTTLSQGDRRNEGSDRRDGD